MNELWEHKNSERLAAINIEPEPSCKGALEMLCLNVLALVAVAR